MSRDVAIKIIEDILDLEANTLTPEALPSDVPSWDSMATVNIIVALESEFSVKFKLEHIQEISQISSFLDLVEKYQASEK